MVRAAWRKRLGADGREQEGRYQYAIVCSCGSYAYAYVDVNAAVGVGLDVEVVPSEREPGVVDVRGDLADKAKVRAWEKLHADTRRGGCAACQETASRWQADTLVLVARLPPSVTLPTRTPRTTSPDASASLWREATERRAQWDALREKLRRL